MLNNLFTYLKQYGFVVLERNMSMFTLDATAALDSTAATEGETLVAVERDNEIYIVKHYDGTFSEPQYIINGNNPYLYYEDGYYLLTFSWNNKIQRLDFTYDEIGAIVAEALNLWSAVKPSTGGAVRPVTDQNSRIRSGTGEVKTGLTRGLEITNYPEEWHWIHPIPSYLTFNGEVMSWGASGEYTFMTDMFYTLYEDGTEIYSGTATAISIQAKSETPYSVTSSYESINSGEEFEGSERHYITALYLYEDDVAYPPASSGYVTNFDTFKTTDYFVIELLENDDTENFINNFPFTGWVSPIDNLKTIDYFVMELVENNAPENTFNSINFSGYTGIEHILKTVDYWPDYISIT